MWGEYKYVHLNYNSKKRVLVELSQTGRGTAAQAPN